jgi:Tetrahydrofolate dehydrogenase/cyclohydrolase, catalytic domain
MLESHSCGGSALIDGKRASKRVLARVAEKTRALAAQGLKPGLAVVLVGEDPASQVYVKSRARPRKPAGFTRFNTTLPRPPAKRNCLPSSKSSMLIRRSTGSFCNCPCPSGSIPAASSKPFHRGRMSMACIRSMSGCSRAAIRSARSCRARRQAAWSFSTWPRRRLASIFRELKPSSSAAPIWLANQSPNCCSAAMRP